MQKFLAALIAGLLGFVVAVLLSFLLLDSHGGGSDGQIAIGMLVFFVFGPLGFVLAAIVAVRVIRFVGNHRLAQPAALGVMLAVLVLGGAGGVSYLFREDAIPASRIDGRPVNVEFEFAFPGNYQLPPPDRRWHMSIHLELQHGTISRDEAVTLAWDQTATREGRVILPGSIEINEYAGDYRALYVQRRQDPYPLFYYRTAFPLPVSRENLEWSAWEDHGTEPGIIAPLQGTEFIGTKLRYRMQFRDGR